MLHLRRITLTKQTTENSPDAEQIAVRFRSFLHEKLSLTDAFLFDMHFLQGKQAVISYKNEIIS